MKAAARRVVGDAVSHAVRTRIIHAQPRQDRAEQGLPVERHRRKRQEEPLRQLIHPRHVHPDEIELLERRRLNHVVYVPQRRQDDHLQPNTRALLQMRQQAGERRGGGGGERQHPQGNGARGLRRHDPYAEAVVLHGQHPRQRHALFEPGANRCLTT